MNRQFTVLSDPGAQVIRSYGLVHPNAGKQGEDIALDTTLLVDVDGKERWRRVSQTLPDLPTTEEILARIRTNQSTPSSKGNIKKPVPSGGCVAPHEE